VALHYVEDFSIEDQTEDSLKLRCQNEGIIDCQTLSNEENDMGPLTGFKIIELAGIVPGPFCGMMLADMGAEVIREDRPGGFDGTRDVLCRGRRSIAVNLKDPEGVEVVLRLCEYANALFEGLRPGVTERLGNVWRAIQNSFMAE